MIKFKSTGFGFTDDQNKPTFCLEVYVEHKHYKKRLEIWKQVRRIALKNIRGIENRIKSKS